MTEEVHHNDVDYMLRGTYCNISETIFDKVLAVYIYEVLHSGLL